MDSPSLFPQYPTASYLCQIWLDRAIEDVRKGQRSLSSLLSFHYTPGFIDQFCSISMRHSSMRRIASSLRSWSRTHLAGKDQLIAPEAFGDIGGNPPELLDERLVLCFCRSGGNMRLIGWRLPSGCSLILVERHPPTGCATSWCASRGKGHEEDDFHRMWEDLVSLLLYWLQDYHRNFPRGTLLIPCVERGDF